MSKPLNISMLARSSDGKLFVSIWDQGIDSHLEAFTASKFRIEDTIVGQRIHFDFDLKEIPILTRRLRELDTDEANQWADDIEASDAL